MKSDPPDRDAFAVLSLPEATAHFEARLRASRDPAERRRLRHQLVPLYARMGRHAQARDTLLALLDESTEPDLNAQHLLNLGVLAEQVDDFAAARVYYQEGLALAAGEPWVRYFLRNNLGYSLNQLGQHHEAEHWCRQALDLDDTRHNAWKNLAVAQEALGDHPAAAAHYLQAAEMRPADPRALGHLQALLARHPEAALHVPGFDERLAWCVEATDAGAVRH